MWQHLSKSFMCMFLGYPLAKYTQIPPSLGWNELENASMLSLPKIHGHYRTNLM
jgi:hypothetical protein